MHRPPVRASDVPAAVTLQGITKSFGSGAHYVLALDRLDLTVMPGELLCILGASGCGKSTVLSLIAGLEEASGGTVNVAGGETALMFQEAALFPWLTVADNVALPLRLQRVAKRERSDITGRLLELVRLQRFAHHRPHQLSGGMRQRVALARALAQRSDVLLMDEPFGAVDAITRDQLHEDLTRIAGESGVTIVFVTHSVREAVRLGDRIVLLSSRPGRVIAEYDLRNRPPHGDAALTERITAQLRQEIGRHGGG